MTFHSKDADCVSVLKEHTTLDLSPEKVHETGLQIVYMAHITGLPNSIVFSEIDSCFNTPGRACAYKIGQMKILELREEEKKRLGDQFDLKEFHGRILNRGIVPLSML